MVGNEISTLDAILSAAEKEFSEKGFQSASLQNRKRRRRNYGCVLRLL